MVIKTKFKTFDIPCLDDVRKKTTDLIFDNLSKLDQFSKFLHLHKF